MSFHLQTISSFEEMRMQFVQTAFFILAKGEEMSRILPLPIFPKIV